MSMGLNDLQNIIRKDGWRDILNELVESQRIDPWDIDMKIVAKEFLKYIKQMRELDLTIPANIILAAAIVLKYKANTLKDIFKEEENDEQNSYEEEIDDIIELNDVPNITFVNRMPPKRKVTLNELIKEIEKVMKYDNKEINKSKKNKFNYEPIRLNINEEDAEKKMAEVYERIKANVDSEGWTTFSRILDKNDSKNIVYTLLALLYLNQREKIRIKQNKLFDVIFIKLIK